MVNTLKWTERIIGDAIILLYIISQVRIGALDVETAMLLITYMTTVIDDVYHRIIEHDFGISEITANMKRITEVLNDENFKNDTFGQNTYDNIKGEVCLENVTFRYTKENKVLENISLKFEPCTKNAIIGLSGAGKTTIFKLLLKEYDNYEGKIKIDGVDIQEFTEESLRNSISVVNQEPIIFNMTVRENLKLANQNATEKDIINACRLANIYDFIESLPNKLDEQISENATNMSSGQKQRLAIARVILRNTKIILLDEITSNLDNYNKKKIQETINNLAKTRTIISIVHSLDSLKYYDNIVFLDDGKIVEQGTNDDLMSKHGKYENFVRGLVEF